MTTNLPSVYSRSLLKVRVPVTVTLAAKKQPIGKIIELVPGSIIAFDKSCDEMLELEVSGHPIAEGECVKVGDKFGLRVTSLILPDEEMRSLRKVVQDARTKQHPHVRVASRLAIRGELQSAGRKASSQNSPLDDAHFTSASAPAPARAQWAVSSSTRITFTGLPAARRSRLQARWARSIRYIVAHMQTTGDRK